MLSDKFLTALAEQLPQQSIETANELTRILVRITGLAPDGQPFGFEYQLPVNDLHLIQLFPTRTAQKVANDFKRAYEKAFPTVYTVADFEAEVKAAGASHWPGWTIRVEPYGIYGKRHQVSFSQNGRTIAQLVYNVPELLTDWLWKQKVWYAVKNRARVELGSYYRPLKHATT